MIMHIHIYVNDCKCIMYSMSRCQTIYQNSNHVEFATRLASSRTRPARMKYIMSPCQWGADKHTLLALLCFKADSLHKNNIKILSIRVHHQHFLWLSMANFVAVPLLLILGVQPFSRPKGQVLHGKLSRCEDTRNGWSLHVCNVWIYSTTHTSRHMIHDSCM